MATWRLRQLSTLRLTDLSSSRVRVGGGPQVVRPANARMLFRKRLARYKKDPY